MTSAKEHGMEDADVFYRETTMQDDEILDMVAKMRGGRDLMPDEALINAVGRTWVLLRAGAIRTDDQEWERLGVPWCQAYNEAWLSTLETLAAGGAS